MLGAIIFYGFLLILIGMVFNWLGSLDRRALQKLKQKENPTEHDLARIRFLEKETYEPPKKVPYKVLPARRCSRKRVEGSNTQIGCLTKKTKNCIM
jgi:hypothetical protein